MKRFLSSAIIFALYLSLPDFSTADPRHATQRTRSFPVRSFSRPWFVPGIPVGFYGYPVSPYDYLNQFYYWPNYPSVVVISPNARAYYYYSTPVVVASAPYFCALHGQGFVSRVGLLDHLSGMHKISLDAASAICPDGAANCYFPLH